MNNLLSLIAEKDLEKLKNDWEKLSIVWVNEKEEDYDLMPK